MARVEQAGRLVVSCVAACGLALSSRAHGQGLSQTALRQMLHGALKDQQIDATRPVIEDIAGPGGQPVMRVHLGGLKPVIGAGGGVSRTSLIAAYPAQLQARVEGLRLFGGDANLRKAWEPHLQRVEAVVTKQLAEVAAAKELNDALRNKLQDLDEEGYAAFREVVQNVARARGRIGELRNVSEAVTFRVRFTYAPGAVHKVSHCPEIYFLISPGGKPAATDWVDVPDPNGQVTVAGHLRFRCQWQDGRETVKSVKVKQDETVHFPLPLAGARP